MNLKVYSNI